MKLTALFMLFFTFNIHANGFGQQRINLHATRTDIADVFKFIEQKTAYRFLYNSSLDQLNTKVTIHAKEATIDEILPVLLFRTALTFQKMEDGLIVIKEDPLAKVDVRVSGTVTDSSGAPLSGVSVQIKGTNAGTVTDAQGRFALAVPSANSTLVFSAVGYEDQEYPLNGTTAVTIRLTASQKIMDQVVVIGYGSANKRDLTGSIVKIDGKEVADKPNTNPVASLQGKVAGLSVVNSGTPGAAPDIRIRGTVSIGQVHPLYIVDGIFNDNIDFINPNDIESIEVLKDPSSLAIFGVKGATGVIAITTKKAKKGQTTINFSTNYGFKKLVDKIKMVDANGFNTLFTEENANNNVPTPPYSQLNSNTDWVNAVTRTGVFNSNNLSISSSSEKNNFFFGLGYTNEDGIVIHENLKKLQLSFNDEVKLSKAIKLGVNFNASRQRNPYDATHVLDNARKVMPNVYAGTKQFKVADPYSGDSVLMNIYSGLATTLQNSGVINPVLEVENTWNTQRDYIYRYVGNVYLDINFLKHFNFRPTWYADFSNQDKRVYQPLYYAYDPITENPYLYSTLTSVTQNQNNWKKFQQDYILTYKNRFGNHNLTATAGFTSYYYGSFLTGAIAKQFTSGSSARPIPNDPRFWYLNSGFNDPSVTTVDPGSTSQYEYTTVSGLARVLYNYNNKYYLNASLRNDASSQLPAKNRNQIYWAVGAGWELTKEAFMQDITAINFLKLKGSIGVLGNQTATRLDGSAIPYPMYPNLNTNKGAVFGTNISNAAQNAYQPNPDLKWETVHAKEVGVELNAFDNRLHFEFNYFDKTTKNLMTYVSRSSQGLPDLLENGGSIKNWGEEFSASWNQQLAKDLSLNIAGNITFLKNKVLSLSPDIPGGFLSRSFMNNGSAEARTIVGQPIGSFYGYVVDGIYQSYADILSSPVASSIGSYRPGDFKFKDVNGDGVITADDRTIIGNPTPKFTYGSTVNLNYKQVSLSVDMGGVYGNSVFRTWASLESPFQRVNYAAIQLDRWHGAGTSNWTPILSQGDRFNYNGSTYNIEDGSYFRLRNVNLAYTFSQRLLHSNWIKGLKIFANVQNLKTWKHNNGYTPEFGGDATAFGFDFAGGAIPRITTFGLNVSF